MSQNESLAMQTPNRTFVKSEPISRAPALAWTNSSSACPYCMTDLYALAVQLTMFIGRANCNSNRVKNSCNFATLRVILVMLRATLSVIFNETFCSCSVHSPSIVLHQVALVIHQTNAFSFSPFSGATRPDRNQPLCWPLTVRRWRLIHHSPNGQKQLVLMAQWWKKRK